MGRAKADMMRLKDMSAQATGVAVKAGAVKQCPVHDTIIEVCDPDADKRAYAIGTNMVKNGEIDGTREEFMDAIKGAIEDASETCNICADYFAKD